jgi:hypothetical protein
MIIILTTTALATWFWPKYGAVHWYNGPRRYISQEEVRNARIVRDSEARRNSWYTRGVVNEPIGDGKGRAK